MATLERAGVLTPQQSVLKLDFQIADLSTVLNDLMALPLDTPLELGPLAARERTLGEESGDSGGDPRLRTATAAASYKSQADLLQANRNHVLAWAELQQTIGRTPGL